MNAKNNNLNALHDIRNMMERSSRFISLSGLSGISAGVCALVGAAFACWVMEDFSQNNYREIYDVAVVNQLRNKLLLISVLIFLSAFLSAFFFTYLRSKKMDIPVWGAASKRMMINVAVPFVAGGILVLRLMDLELYGLLAPVCLIVYGISLFCGSQYSTNEIRYLAYSEMLLGFISLWFLGYGLLFWTIGFGVFHIVYGFIMWFKYERK